MPQASEELRAKFEDDYAARLVLEGAGWTCNAGWWSMPTHEPSEDEWEAITYLIHEWDHAIRKPSDACSLRGATVTCTEALRQHGASMGAADYVASMGLLAGKEPT